MLGLGDLYDIFHSTVRLFSRRYYGSLSPQDVEDAVQTTIIQIWRRNEELDFRNLFFFTVNQRCVDLVRYHQAGIRQGKETALATPVGEFGLTLGETLPDPTPSLEERYVQREALADVLSTHSGRYVARYVLYGEGNAANAYERRKAVRREITRHAAS